jgi:hypothetical protein
MLMVRQTLGLIGFLLQIIMQAIFNISKGKLFGLTIDEIAELYQP